MQPLVTAQFEVLNIWHFISDRCLSSAKLNRCRWLWSTDCKAWKSWGKIVSYFILYFVPMINWYGILKVLLICSSHCFVMMGPITYERSDSIKNSLTSLEDDFWVVNNTFMLLFYESMKLHIVYHDFINNSVYIMSVHQYKLFCLLLIFYTLRAT